MPPTARSRTHTSSSILVLYRPRLRCIERAAAVRSRCVAVTVVIVVVVIVIVVVFAPSILYSFLASSPTPVVISYIITVIARGKSAEQVFLILLYFMYVQDVYAKSVPCTNVIRRLPWDDSKQ